MGLLEIISGRPLQYAKTLPDTTHSGYFLGGNMWWGRLLVPNGLAPGKYPVNIRPKEYPPGKPGYQIRLAVYPDPLSQRSGYYSFPKRQTGSSPLSLDGEAPAVNRPDLCRGLFLSRRIDVLDAAKGIAGSTHVKRLNGGCLITFDLGRKHGLNLISLK